MNFPVFPENSQSLAAKHLTYQLFEKLKHRQTSKGYSLEKAVRSGRINIDSAIGVYAGDSETYQTFALLFEPIINDYHGIDAGQPHQSRFEPVDLSDLDPEKRYILSTRVRVARNLRGYPFTSYITLDDRRRLQNEIVKATEALPGKLGGNYWPLVEIDQIQRLELEKQNLLFRAGDRFQHAAGINSDFPNGRGVFLSTDRSLRIWVNEEDHLRIISQNKSTMLSGVFNNLIKALHVLEAKLDFARDHLYGYLTTCPTNIGTSMRAGVHIRLDQLKNNIQLLNTITRMHNLQIRGTKGEKTTVEDGVFDISNRQRLGITEVEIIRTLHRGLLAIIDVEKNLEAGKTP